MPDIKQRIADFAKYHNAVPIAVSLVVFMTAGIFAASSEVREGVKKGFISGEETVQSIDNTLLLAADLENFDFDLRITNVSEDEQNYYVDYSFNTFLLDDYIWKVMPKPGSLKIGRSVLGARDLGDYVAEELKELIDFERKYLAETQNLEKINGASRKVVTETYSGLIGKYLDPKETVFEGYDKVVKDDLLADLSPGLSNDLPKATNGFTEDYIKALFQNMIDAKNGSAVAIADPLPAGVISASTTDELAGSSSAVSGPVADKGQKAGIAKDKLLPIAETNTATTTSPN